MTTAPKKVKRVTRSTTITSPAPKPKAAPASSVPHVAASPAPEPPKFVPRAEPPVSERKPYGDGVKLGVLAALVLLAIGVGYALRGETKVASSNPPPVVNNQPVGGAPVVGSTLPKDMIPGTWYATGNTKVVPSGTVVDTKPKDCTRDGVRGECALKKRGT